MHTLPQVPHITPCASPPLRSPFNSFSIYYEDGRPAPPRALDSAKERGETFVAYGTLVAPLTADVRAKLVALDMRLKGRIPPCLPKRSDGAALEPLPWVSTPAPTATAKGASTGTGTGAGAGGAASSARGGRGGAKKPRPRVKAEHAPSKPGGAGASGVGDWGQGHPDGPYSRWGHGGNADGSGGIWGGGDDGGGYDGGDGGGSAGGGKRPRKSTARWSPDEDPERRMQVYPAVGGGGEGGRGSPYTPEYHHMYDGRGMGYPMERVAENGAGPLPPPPPLQLPVQAGGGGAGGTLEAMSLDSSAAPGGATNAKKRKAEASSAAAASNKRQKPPPSFSYAAFVGGLDGSETRGVPGTEFVGSSFRRGREDGLLLYYVDRAPRDYPFEYESKAAGAASLDWSCMCKLLKVDAFCMETFRWYGAKVAEVSIERQQVKVRGCTTQPAPPVGLRFSSCVFSPRKMLFVDLSGRKRQSTKVGKRCPSWLSC